MRIRMKGYSASLRNKRVKGHAKRHARKGVEASPDLVVTKLIGPPIVIDVENNPTHQRLHRESQHDPRVASWQEELRTVEKERTKHSSRWLLWLTFLFLLVVEFAGISQLLAAQGMENPERNVVAIAGSCILFYLTFKASQQVLAKKKSIWFYLLMTGIGVLVFSVALLRREETSVEDAWTLSNVASALFMTIVTLGPGLLAKEIFARLLPVEVLARNRRRLRKEILGAERKRKRAQDELDQLALARDWHVQESGQITAVYLLEYREAGGIVKLTNPYPQVSAFPRRSEHVN